jgi:hypothetical protein
MRSGTSLGLRTRLKIIVSQTMSEEFEVIEDGPRQQTNFEIWHGKAIAYSFIAGLFGIAAAVLVNALGYEEYYYYVLLGSLAPMALLLVPSIVYITLIKPHKVGKYVLKHKQLPDDMKQDS